MHQFLARKKTGPPAFPGWPGGGVGKDVLDAARIVMDQLPTR